MKIINVLLLLLASLNLNAEVTGIMCQEDERMNNGGLREVTLAKGEDGYFLQTRTIAALSSPENDMATLAAGLECRLDDGKMAIGLCQSADGMTQVMVKEVKEIFYDSMNPDDKRKTAKSLVIMITENGETKSTIGFNSNNCQTH